MKDEICVYTDGGCISNPGGAGGYGTVLLYSYPKENPKEVRLSQGYISTTNNRMELMALLAALEFIEYEGNYEDKHIKFFADSKYVIDVVSGKMNARANMDLITQLKDGLKDKDYEFVWVKGHNGNTYNEICDQMASAAMNSHELIPDAGYVEVT